MRYRVLTAAFALVGSLIVGSPASAAATAFTNCTAMHKVYKNGVAKSTYAASHAKPANIKPPKVSSSLYINNRGLDRDKDGVACEVAR